VRQGGGAAREDTSRGYRLIKYPPARKLELEVRRYALRHEAELSNVLEDCAIAEQRAIAADALGELLSADPSTAKHVLADVFLDMIASGIWTDRNKASFVLAALARSNDPQLAAQIKSQAWQPLIEMARWRDTGHAAMPRLVLGRVAGMPEDRLSQLVFGPPGPFLDALGTR
jgi:hypothetical protein